MSDELTSFFSKAIETVGAKIDDVIIWLDKLGKDISDGLQGVPPQQAIVQPTPLTTGGPPPPPPPPPLTTGGPPPPPPPPPLTTGGPPPPPPPPPLTTGGPPPPPPPPPLTTGGPPPPPPPPLTTGGPPPPPPPPLTTGGPPPPPPPPLTTGGPPPPPPLTTGGPPPPPPKTTGGPPPPPPKTTGGPQPTLTTGGTTGTPSVGLKPTAKKVVAKAPTKPPRIPVPVPGGLTSDALKPVDIDKIKKECAKDPAKRQEWIDCYKNSTTDLETKEMLFSIAYNTKFGKVFEPHEKRGEALDKIAELLADFPIEHLPGEWLIEEGTGRGTGGSYDNNIAQITYGRDDMPNPNIPGFTQEYTNCTNVSQALAGTKGFEVLIKHEVGHHADVKARGSTLTALDPQGGWKIYPSEKAAVESAEFTGLAKEFFDDVVGKLEDAALPALTQSVLMDIFIKAGEAKAIAAVLAETSKGYTKLSAKNVSGLAPEHLTWVEAAVDPGHKIFVMFEQARAGCFKLGGSPVDHGDRVLLQWAALESWTSFTKSSYGSRVSDYQYNSPTEWFAEYYTTANNNDKAVREKAAQAYPGAWTWFESHGLLVKGP